MVFKVNHLNVESRIRGQLNDKKRKNKNSKRLFDRIFDH